MAVFMIVFVILAIEMVLAVMLCLPLPKFIQKGLIGFVDALVGSGNVRYVTASLFVFVLILFGDALLDMIKMRSEEAIVSAADTATANIEIYLSKQKNVSGRA